jgi:hypothetical protein
MLPRTARAGLVARRQFHYSSLQFAKPKSNKASKTAIRVVATPGKNPPANGPSRTRQSEDPTAEQVARDALARFFLSAKLSSKGKAAQARHYGTLALEHHASFAAEEGEKKTPTADGKRADSESPADKLPKESQSKQSDTKDESTDKAKEEPKDNKDVRSYLLSASLKSNLHFPEKN